MKLRVVRQEEPADEVLDRAKIRGRLVWLRKDRSGDEPGAQTRFCEKYDLNTKAWNNWEKGGRIPSLKEAVKLTQKIPGISLDWIFLD